MKINFYANFRQLAGGKTAEFDRPDGSSLQMLVAAVMERFPALGTALVDQNGALLPHVHLFVNGRDAQFLPEGMETRVTSADKIDIFPPVAGG